MENRRSENHFFMKEVLEKLVKELRIEPKLDQSEILQIWENEMGPMVNKHTKKISFRDSTIYIELDSAALKNELSMEKSKIKNLLNEAIGKEVIEKVVIR